MNYETFNKGCLEEAKRLYKTANANQRYVLGKLFPELRESEDERIRRVIRGWIYTRPASFFDNGISKEVMLAWLEKQGEPVDKEKVLIGARRDVALSIMNFLDRNTLGMCLSNMECADIESAVVDSDWSKVYDYMKKKLEKQGEQKSLNDVAKEVTKNKETAISFLKSCGIMNANGELADEYKIEQGEQKPSDTCNSLIINKKKFPAGFEKMKEAGWEFDFEKKELKKSNSYCQENCKGFQETGKCFADGDCKAKREAESIDKVESKFNFKAGQWIVATGKCVYLITNIYGFNVTLFDVDGNEYVFDTSSLEDAHLWTIQDAKDGDVLAFYSEYKGNKMVQVGIIEKYVGKHGGCSNTFKIHVGVNWENNLQIGEYMGCSDIRPATKEQRDTLMKAMADAGYTFDFEKKELKNIEQIQAIDYPDSLPKDNWELVHEFIEKFGRIPEDEDELNVLVEYVLKRQKPAEWSEEDKTKRNALIGLVEEIKRQPLKRLEDWDGYISWLKSIGPHNVIND